MREIVALSVPGFVSPILALDMWFKLNPIRLELSLYENSIWLLNSRLFPKSLLKRMADFNGKFFPGLENLTRESIENIINFPKNIDNSKAKKDLGLKISPLDKTIKDSIYG